MPISVLVISEVIVDLVNKSRNVILLAVF